jgi:hypothetical protein
MNITFLADTTVQVNYTFEVKDSGTTNDAFKTVVKIIGLPAQVITTANAVAWDTNWSAAGKTQILVEDAIGDHFETTIEANTGPAVATNPTAAEIAPATAGDLLLSQNNAKLSVVGGNLKFTGVPMNITFLADTTVQVNYTFEVKDTSTPNLVFNAVKYYLQLQAEDLDVPYADSTPTKGEFDAASITHFANLYANRAAVVLTGTTMGGTAGDAITPTTLYSYILGLDNYTVHPKVDMTLKVGSANTEVVVKVRAIVKG